MYFQLPFLYDFFKIHSARILFGIFFIMVFISSVRSQTTKLPNTNQPVNYWKLDINYLSDYVYMGRKDSLPTPYLTPTLTYYHVSGFYFSGSLSYLSEKKSRRIDYGSLDIGYSFNLSEQFGGDIYANKSWYNQSSTNVASDIKGYIGALMNYDLHLIQVNGGMDLLFSNKPDFTCNLGASHAFQLGEKEYQITITPSFTANWSTLHSYEGYINRRVGKRPGIIVPVNNTISAITRVENNRLTLMDFELSIPFNYESPRFGISFTPSLAIPRNPIYTTTTIITTTPSGIQNSQTFPSTPASELDLQNRFYAELSFYIKF